MSVELPENWPQLGDPPEAFAFWVSKATLHDIVGTWRPGRTERSALVVRLGDGHELLFETVAEACRPERFLSAFMSIDGIVMPSYSGPQVRQLVGALVQMAQIDRDRSEDEEYADAGARFLRACLTRAGTIEVKLNEESEEGRALVYRTAIRYAVLLSTLHGDPGEPSPPVLHATDRRLLHVPRGLFLTFARKTIRGVTVASFNAQMRRLGWNDVTLQPRKPGKPDAPRTFLRLWEVADGWDGISASEGDGAGCVDAPGYSEARAGARGAPVEAHPPASAHPRNSADRRPL